MALLTLRCPFKARDDRVELFGTCDTDCQAYDKEEDGCGFVTTARALEIMANNITDEIRKVRKP